MNVMYGFKGRVPPASVVTLMIAQFVFKRNDDCLSAFDMFAIRSRAD